MNRLFLLLALVGLTSCAKNAQLSSSQSAEIRTTEPSEALNDKWVNPILEHRLTQRETPFRSFPFDANQSDLERLDSAGFNDFIQRINSSFVESNISIDDANLIYSIIQNSDLLRIDPGASNPHSSSASSDILPMDKVRSRVAIKALDGDLSFAIFYKRHECGWNYSYEEIEINPSDSVITKVYIIETWVARTPC